MEMNIAKILAWIGIILAIVDFFSLSEKLEKIIDGKREEYKNWIKTSWNSFVKTDKSEENEKLTLASALGCFNIMFFGIIGFFVFAISIGLFSKYFTTPILSLFGLENDKYWLFGLNGGFMLISFFIIILRVITIGKYIITAILWSIWYVAHLFNKPKKGTIGTIGFILAIIGLLGEYF